MFSPLSRREPEEAEDATKGRDVFNEKPPPEELLAVSDLGSTATTSLPDNLVMFLILFKSLLEMFKIQIHLFSSFSELKKCTLNLSNLRDFSVLVFFFIILFIIKEHQFFFAGHAYIHG